MVLSEQHTGQCNKTYAWGQKRSHSSRIHRGYYAGVYMEGKELRIDGTLRKMSVARVVMERKDVTFL